MANYKESSTIGTTWRRCETVTIRNKLNKVPGILFMEEDVINVGDTFITNSVGAISKQFSIAEQIPIIDPITGILTGNTITHGELYTILYSLYMQTALERDAQQQVA